VRASFAVSVWLLLLATALARAETTEQEARRVAADLGQALLRGDASRLGPLLPLEGKVRLRLVSLGPEDGSYSAEQVEALFQGFLRQGRVRTFDLRRVHCVSEQFALMRARAQIQDGEGRAREVDLHLTLEPEAGRWVLRELRETPP
jgi:hypothetical protein